MKVVVVGAGGLGSYLGGVLARAGHDVHLVGRGEHRTAIQDRGLCIRDGDSEAFVHPTCSADAADSLGPEVALVTVKAYSLEEVAPQVAGLAESGAIVIPLCNGVDACERLANLGTPADKLVAGVAYVTAFRTQPGVVERQGLHGRIVVGRPSLGDPAPDGAKATDSLPPDLVALFRDTPITLETTPDIGLELWRKMAVVCSLSVICGIARAPIGAIRGTNFGTRLATQAIAEVLAVGKAQGTQLEAKDQEHVEAILSSFPADFYPSVIHDLRQGRRTEMEALGGTISRMGRTLGIPTPLHDAANVAIALDAAQL